jgi:hypothetical protein
MWMDGALMGVPFSSLSVPGLTRVANSGWWPYSYFWEHFFFSSPRSHLPTYLHLDYLPMHPGLLSPPPTYLPTYLPTHTIICLSTSYLLTYLPNHLPIYLPMYTLKFHQGNGNANQWGYCHIPSRLLRCPFYVFNRPRNFVIVKNNVTMMQMKILQLNWIFLYNPIKFNN